MGRPDCYLGPTVEEEAVGDSGLSHHGDPEEEEEVIVVEEPEREDPPPVKVVRAPRMPTQAEIDAHMAAHLPHADWCEICVKGRGRNSPHRRKSKDEPEGADSLGSAPEGSEKEGSPVPKVSMDYFYLSKQETSQKKGAKAMSTKELQKKLRDLGKSDRGSRPELVQRYEKLSLIHISEPTRPY